MLARGEEANGIVGDSNWVVSKLMGGYVTGTIVGTFVAITLKMYGVGNCTMVAVAVGIVGN